MTTTKPLLDVRGLRVGFGGRDVVHGLDFQVAPGEKVALVGESGSGKTVSALALLRLLADATVSGQAHFDAPRDSGEPCDLLAAPEGTLRGIRGQDIAMIFQEPMTALNPLLTIGAQVAEVLILKRGLATAAAWQQTIALLADTGIPEPERRARSYPHQLSGGQRQRAMIAMALAGQPQLLLADEPTTALDVTLRGQILDLVDRLQRQRGMAVLLITHDLNLVRRFADRVIVLEQGVIVEQGRVSEVFHAPRHAYTQRLLDSRPTRDPQAPPVPTGSPVMQADGLRVSYPLPVRGWAGWWRRDAFIAVQRASFSIGPGQTLGVIGESGSGKSTLALAALGLMPFEGQLLIDGRAWAGRAQVDRALRQVVQVVFQDPFSSLSPRLTVEEIVGEGLQVHAPTMPLAERQDKVLAALAEVGLLPSQFEGLLARYPHEFSGGQRQRLAIARALILQPRLLVLDEPTSALDVTIQKRVLELLQRLQRQRQLSYLLITHDVDVIRAMAHEVIVMKEGQIVEQGPLASVLDAPRHDYTRALVHAAG